MKTTINLLVLCLLLAGCYEAEDAADVNQDRIKLTYCTVFDGTHNTTKTQLDFRFGITPLRVSNSPQFQQNALFEQHDPIFGLHYSRLLEGSRDGTYRWRNEEGEILNNFVEALSFELINPPRRLRKRRAYTLEWNGEINRYSDDEFVVTITSQGITCSSHGGNSIEIYPSDIATLPTGPATMIVARNYAEPIDEGTEAGGSSEVTYQIEYEINIVE